MTKLEHWRIRRKLSIKDLSDQSGVNRATITRIEHGNVNPSGKTLGRLAETLEVDPVELLETANKETGPSWDEHELAEAHFRIESNAGKPAVSQEQAKAEIERFFEQLREKYNSPNQASA